MKKFISLFFVMMVCFIGINTAKAESYYTNEYGVSFTKEEYNFFSKMYYEGYQETMTPEERAKYPESNLDINKIETVSYTDYSFDPNRITTKGNYHETQAKILQMNIYTGEISTVSITATWKYSPNVRSYDIIGAYLSNVTMIGSPLSKVVSTNGTVYPSSTISSSLGFGAVIKLPTNGDNIRVNTTFEITGSGTVFGSYQHAKSTISLANARSFSISYSGLGNVFYFSNMNIRAKYDAMQGVSVNV